MASNAADCGSSMTMVMESGLSCAGGGSSSIADFYRDRSIFITGATGFMGKVLVEKLLRSCPGIKTLYLLMRPKCGSDIKRRVTEMLNAKLFDELKRENADVLQKLVPISGDVTLPGLGIDPSDTQILVDQVSIVFHAAATVKFDEPLKLSVSMNVQGTQRIVELCHQMKHLVALIHVSTAYCNCDLEEVNEVIYKPPIDPKRLIECIQWMDEDMINNITPKLLGNRPNTYTFTKALAEHILVEECGNLPVCIVRPSIVTGAVREPIPGWVDNLNGPTGLIAGAGKGVLRTIFCKSEMIADLVPVDIPINLMITVAWSTATVRPKEIPVYNCTSGTVNPIRWSDIRDLGFCCLVKNPFNDVVWYPGGDFTSSRAWNKIMIYMMHYLPAYVFDIKARLTGKKPIMTRIQTKLHRAVKCLEFFTTHQWRFNSHNMYSLQEKMTSTDRKVFNFDVRQLDWKAYMEDYCLGTRSFVLKEDLNTLPSARRHIKRMYILHRFSQILLFITMWKALSLQTTIAKNMWTVLVQLVLRFSRLLPIAGN